MQLGIPVTTHFRSPVIPDFCPSCGNPSPQGEIIASAEIHGKVTVSSQVVGTAVTTNQYGQKGIETTTQYKYNEQKFPVEFRLCEHCSPKYKKLVPVVKFNNIFARIIAILVTILVVYASFRPVISLDFTATLGGLWPFIAVVCGFPIYTMVIAMIYFLTEHFIRSLILILYPLSGASIREKLKLGKDYIVVLPKNIDGDLTPDWLTYHFSERDFTEKFKLANESIVRDTVITN